MKSVKYYFNTTTLRYEKVSIPLRVWLLRIFGFISIVMICSALLIWLYNKYVPKPTEIEAQRKYEQMQDNYRGLQKKMAEMDNRMDALEHRDNDVYRSIFEANPVPDSARAKLIEEKQNLAKYTITTDEQLGKDIAAQINNINARMVYQERSYNDIQNLINNQKERLASIPAIQPLSNKQLDRIASGFGMRIDPVYGTPKMHKGLDFTAPQGTPIYATGDGKVTLASNQNDGYGNHVVINHGYGYETLYGHMVRIKVRGGQAVKRGDLIGWVGSTGKSTGPHCHYEVHINGEAVDPVYFFYNDLTPAEYDQLLKIAATGSAKSLD